jgi:hypothetical protein
MVHQNLVIAKVVGRVQHEELVFEFVPERDHYSSLEDHEQLVEVLSSFDYALVRYVNTAVERHDEERNKFISCIRTLVSENMLELSLEVTEKLTN